MRLLYSAAAVALSASALLFLYGTWLWIIQKANRLADWSTVLLVVGLACLLAGFMMSKR